MGLSSTNISSVSDVQSYNLQCNTSPVLVRGERNCLQATWRYSKDAVQLHIMYLRNAPHGAEAHTVVVSEIPGIYAGIPVRSHPSFLHTSNTD